MAQRDDIRPGLQVLGSDGGMIGRVVRLHEQHIHVEPTAPAPDAQDHTIPLDWVAHVDGEHVHLNVPAATARDRWGADDGVRGAYGGGAAPQPAPTPARRSNWIPWLIGVILLAAILFIATRSCDYAADSSDYQGSAADLNGALSDVELQAGAAGAAGAAAATAPLSTAEAYLSGSETAPRTFAFEKLNFDTSKADVRPQDRAEIAQLNTLLQRYPMVAIQVIGYADARGDDAANATLGQRRADAVKAALVAAGTAATRITARSGGEAQPVATNATAGGQFENRRTEVIITR